MKTSTLTPEQIHKKPNMVTGKQLTAKANPLSPELLHKINAYWRAANYLSVGQIYFMTTRC
jgi:phosphoketolase